MARIAVGMSGGVDSSITAALLKDQGHEVEGLTLDLLPDWLKASETPAVQAQRVAAELGIPHHVLDLRRSFEEKVLRPFADGYTQGHTPNPCVLCNENIKFGLLYDWAREHGFDAVATGHYVRVIKSGDTHYLARPLDAHKDQTYFMYRVRPDIIAHLVFPLGELTKPEVRAIAQSKGLSVADKPESQDTCFSSQCSHVEVTEHYQMQGQASGEIVNKKGEVLGQHTGLINYTIGQRKGLPAGLQIPHYVVEIDAALNRVVIGTKEETYISKVELKEVVGNFELGAQYDTQLRYRMTAQAAQVTALDTQKATLTLTFSEPLSGIASGQSAVCYSKLEGNEVVIGGGVIACVS